MHESKTIVLFDIDYTLFDVQAFGEQVNTPLAKKLGIHDKKKFLSFAKVSNEKSKLEHGYYHPETYLNSLKELAQSSVALEDLEEIYYNEEFYKLALYKDAELVFEELVKKGIEIGIFSRGFKQFQLKKILALKKHLMDEKIHIFTNKLDKLPEVLLQYKDYKVYIVDDMMIILEEAKRINKAVSTILIKRTARAEFQTGFDNFKADHEIEQLKDLLLLV